MRLAEAEAARARSKLVAEITTLQADIEAAKAAVNEGKERYEPQSTSARKRSSAKRT